MGLGIVIQARMGSKRLPGKILKLIGDKRLLEHVIYRLDFLNHPAHVIIATSNLQTDDIVEEFCNSVGIECFRGSEQNVLERYCCCSEKYNLDNIVRLTGDNPFVDISELDRLIDLHQISKADYSHSFDILPKGAGAEIFTFKALEESLRCASKNDHYEHVNEYIIENNNKFNILSLNQSGQQYRTDISLTVDTIDDYKKACFIVENSNNEFITTEEAIELCLRYVQRHLIAKDLVIYFE